MKKRGLTIIKLLTVIILLLSVIVPTIFTVSKYVLARNGTYSFTLCGTTFDGTNLVVDNTITYTDALVTYDNPERGLFIQHDVVLSDPYDSADLESALTTAATTKSQLSTSSLSLVRLVVYMNNYRSKNISSDWLDALDTIVDSYRSDGYKVIVRFGYFRDDTSSDPDDFNQVLTHMDQLEDFFDTNQDVIHAVELGFIGKWGESHSSPYATSEYRNQVLEKALEIVPSPINILIRRPEYYEDYFGEGYFDHKIGYSNEDKARVGIYNDGMLASDSDYGTYTGFSYFVNDGRSGALKWVDYLSKYTLSGGEVVHVDGNESYYTLTNAFSDLKRMHVNFLNKNYHTTILDYFRNNNITSDIDADYNGQNAYKYLKDKLGYRFLVSEVKVPNYNVKQGETLNFSFKIKNTGFGNLVRKRPVKIIIEKGYKFYTIDTEIDPRYWFSGEETNEEVALKLPGNIEAGTWNIYLQLPDASASLSNHERYYIKFANNNVWNQHLFANKIGQFTVETKTNSSNNGMYQINTIEDLSEDNTPLTVIRPVTIDGNITDATEWIAADEVYNMYGESVSMRSVRQNLYLYIDPNTYDPTTTYIRIYFANGTSTTLRDFKYEIENGYIYNYSNGSVGSQIGAVENAKGTGFEYRIPFSTIGISSISDLKELKIEYINSSNWNKYGEYFVNLDSTSMVIDGQKSNNTEYVAGDIFHTETGVNVYMKIVDGYLYVYDEDADVSTASRVDLYLGNDNPSNFSNLTIDGFIFTYRDNALMCDNATNTCPAANTVFDTSKGKNIGAEYKIPISSIGITSISDLRNVKLIYKSGSTDVKTIDIPYKYTTSQFTGKTVIVAQKPVDWTSIYAYFYLEDGATYFAWPGIKMYEIEDDSGKYAFVLPSEISPSAQYVIFNNNISSNLKQMPGNNYLIYNFKSGDHKIWDGTIVSYDNLNSTNALETWHSYPTAITTDNNIKFKIKINDTSWNVSSYGVCVHVYANEGNITGSWPGQPLTLNNSTGFYEGTVDATGTYNNIRVIFNNCNHSKQYPASNGLKIKKGITLTIQDALNSSSQYYYKYYVTDDNT